MTHEDKRLIGNLGGQKDKRREKEALVSLEEVVFEVVKDSAALVWGGKQVKLVFSL